MDVNFTDESPGRGTVNMCAYHEAAGLFAIHKSFGDSVSSQDLITTRKQESNINRSLPKFYN